jgi:spore germination protein KB
MPTQQNKITTRQLFVMFVLATLSPSIRLFPQICSEYGGIAGWTGPILATAAFALLIAVLNALFKDNKFRDMSDVFEQALGKPAGKALLVIVLVWVVLLYFLYIRYYADRLLSSIYPNTNIRFFIIFISIPVFIALRGRIETFARFSEFSIIMFTIIFVVFYLLLVPSFRLSNVYPLTLYDAWPAVRAAFPVVGIWAYISLLLFLGDYVIKKEEFKAIGKKTAVYLIIMTTLMIVLVVGALGYRLAERIPLPFFGVTKLIAIMESFDRLEPVLLSVWLVSDFIVISVFGLVIANIAKRLFNAGQRKYFAAPVVLLGYTGSLFICTSRFELEVFSAKFALPANVVLCFALPVVLFIVAKARKKI